MTNFLDYGKYTFLIKNWYVLKMICQLWLFHLYSKNKLEDVPGIKKFILLHRL